MHGYLPAEVAPLELHLSGTTCVRRVKRVGRAGQPADIAAAYVLLASDDGSYISGAVVPVTGGKPILGA